MKQVKRYAAKAILAVTYLTTHGLWKYAIDWALKNK